jgi:ubiquinone/menaquinone biosynthesis C-methylase UbiE
LRLPGQPGQTLLDIGCSWGRWSIAAARKGYDVVGIDPSLGAIMAAKRVSASLGAAARWVVADARFLPFAPQSFAVVFSYSVLQHFSKGDAAIALGEVARVLRAGGNSLIQMSNALGIRSLQHQLRRGFRPAKEFEVRYWTPRELKKMFQRRIGETKLSVDGYFGLGIQATDDEMLPFKYRAVVRASELLRGLSRKAPFLSWFADSVYLHSRTL